MLSLAVIAPKATVFVSLPHLLHSVWSEGWRTLDSGSNRKLHRPRCGYEARRDSARRSIKVPGCALHPILMHLCKAHWLVLCSDHVGAFLPTSTS